MKTTSSPYNVLANILFAIAGIVCGVLLLLVGLTAPNSAAAKTGNFSVAGNRPVTAAQSVKGVSDCSYDWRVASSPSPGTLANYLNSIAVVASDNIWVVGSYSSGSGYHTLIEHWDGTTWSIVSSPNIGTDDQLTGVSVVSANDIWAVGNYVSGHSHTFILHWDGTAWTTVTSPGDGQSDFYPEEVSALSANNVWAVGFYQTGNNPDHTMALHWDGSAWTTVASPNFGSYDNVLLGLTTVATNDIWAVGYYGTGGSLHWQPLIEHWDGTQWNVVPSPTMGLSTSLDGVTAISASNIWAVGHSAGPSVAHTLIEHWDGSTWSIVSSPNVGTYDNYFHAVKAFSSSNIWAVGYYYDGNLFQTLTEHWDGTTWSIVATPTYTNFQNELRSVAFVSGDDAWAVGIADPNTLAEHYSYGCMGTPTDTPIVVSTATPTAAPSATSSATSSVVPTESATSVPSDTATVGPTTTLIATASSTPSGSATPSPVDTGTATPIFPTPTVCTLSFSDVPTGSTFYPYIQCLACLGIINGYPDGTFKPNNNVTRGQLSKIVSNAAGFSDPQTTQMFEDVPVDSTFQMYIGRLASRGYITGYACGGPGEPCGSGNLPYFRPNSNATRGQISKIDSNAAGFNDPAGGQQFEDVTEGSTYYTYTYRLVSRGVMTGYPCGGPGEPCVPSSNLPYFRPNSNATRGQTSKIVSNTFFPNCASQAQ